MRRLLIVALLLSSAAMAQTTYHAPISTGDTSRHCGTDQNESSGTVWYDNGNVWFNIEQTIIEVWNADCSTRIRTSNGAACGGASNQNEDCTIISPSSDVMWMRSEPGGNGICRFDAAAVADSGSYVVDETLRLDDNDGNTDLSTFCSDDWPGNNDGQAEGFVFVPDSDYVGNTCDTSVCTGGPLDGEACGDADDCNCRYDGVFIAADQNAGHYFKFCIHPTDTTMVCTERIAKVNCDGSAETAEMQYDFENDLIYLYTDGGDAFCHTTPANFGTSWTAGGTMPVNGQGNNGYEGFAIGGPAGVIAMSEDQSGSVNNAYNGLYLYEDSYCGDDFTSSVETCDGTDLDGKDCTDCGEGPCGAGATGTLACSATCDGFDTSSCIAPWYNASWSYRVKITVDSDEVDATLTNYPVYVDLNDLPAGFHANVNQTDARDIRVTSDDGTTEVAREVVYYTSGTDTGELHFIVASLSSSVDTDFFIYYGNAAAADYAVDATYGRDAVWNSNYLGVWHLGDGDSTAADFYKDSTGNGWDSQLVDTDGDSASVAGQLGLAMDFAGGADEDYIVVDDADGFTPLVATGQSATISLWTSIETLTPGSNKVVIEQAAGTPDRAFFYFEKNSDTMRWVPNAITNTSPALTAGQLYYFVGTVNGTNAQMWQDGVEIGSSTAYTVQDTGGDLWIGCGPIFTANDPWPGIVDEVRISGIAMAETWTTTEYSNQNAPATFYSVGSEESSSSRSRYLSSGAGRRVTWQ